MLPLNVSNHLPNYSRVTSRKNEALNHTAAHDSLLFLKVNELLCMVHVSALFPRLRVCLSVCLTGSLAWLTVLCINPYTKASHFLGNPPSSSVTHPPPTCYQHPSSPTLTCTGRQGKSQLSYISRTVRICCVCNREKKHFVARAEWIQKSEVCVCVCVCVCACVRNKDENQWTKTKDRRQVETSLGRPDGDGKFQ